jgi:hypothetical protein
MKTALKVILGLVTTSVVICPFMAIALWFWFLTSYQNQILQSMRYPGTLPTYAPWIFGFPLLFFLSIGLLVVLQGFYIVHNIVNKVGSDVIRAILGLGTFFLPVIALPIYYCIYILPKTPPVWALTQAPVQLMAPAQSAP